jgi:hypothetical protein
MNPNISNKNDFILIDTREHCESLSSFVKIAVWEAFGKTSEHTGNAGLPLIRLAVCRGLCQCPPKCYM